MPTGYLLADGRDLSEVFMPVGVLSANNVFTGTNTFSGLTTINAGLALPSNGTATTRTQLGYNYKLTCPDKGSFTAAWTNIGTLPANTLVPGTYIVNVVYPITGTIAAFFMVLSRTNGYEAGNNSITRTKVGFYSRPSGATRSGSFSTIIKILTGETFYLSIYVEPSGTVTSTGGSLIFTRIA
jgi:hypothetical protein